MKPRSEDSLDCSTEFVGLFAEMHHLGTERKQFYIDLGVYLNVCIGRDDVHHRMFASSWSPHFCPISASFQPHLDQRQRNCVK